MVQNMVTSEYAVISPVWAWNARRELALPGNIRIAEISESEKPRFEEWKEALSGRQIGTLSKTGFWFRYDFEDEPFRITEGQRRAIELVQNAVLAYQVARPVGTDEAGSFVILCERTHDVLVPVSLNHYRALVTTQWGSYQVLEPVDLKVLPVVVAGVQDAFSKKIVRLQNPLNLLELGEQADNVHIRILLWVTALDALLMAGNPKKFERRLYNLLGAQPFVFPGSASLPQPRYTLCDVAGDLYELRSEIAHGKKIPKKFREEIGFEDVERNLVDGYERSYRRRQILEEAALFLLCSALRTVFTNGLTETVADAARWRDYLEKSNL